MRNVILIIGLCVFCVQARASDLALNVNGCGSVRALAAFMKTLWVGVNAEPCNQLLQHSQSHIFVIADGVILHDLALPKAHQDEKQQVLGIRANSEVSADVYVGYTQSNELWHYRISGESSDSGVKVSSSWSGGFKFQAVFALAAIPEILVAATDGYHEKLWLLSNDVPKWSRVIQTALPINSAGTARNLLAILYSVDDQKNGNSKLEILDLEGKTIRNFDLRGFGPTLVGTDRNLYALGAEGTDIFLSSIDMSGAAISSHKCPELEGAPLLAGTSNQLLVGIGQVTATHKFSQFLLNTTCDIANLSDISNLYTAFQALGEPVVGATSDYLYRFRHTMEYKGKQTNIGVTTTPLLRSH